MQKEVKFGKGCLLSFLSIFASSHLLEFYSYQISHVEQIQLQAKNNNHNDYTPSASMSYCMLRTVPDSL
jgi:hypothetical protein